MEFDKIDDLSNKILRRLKNEKEIRDELISLFLEWTLNAIEKYEFLDLPRNFYLLKEKVYKSRMYDKLDELEANRVFAYGSLWSAIRLIELAEERKNDEVSIDILAKKYIKNIEIFQMIERCPGIKHKDLAEGCRKTPSELSQFFNQVGEQRFVSFIRLGREKYYYLEEKGTSLLKQMIKQCGNNVDSELAATRNTFIQTSTFYLISKSNIDIDNSLNCDDNSFKNEYFSEFKDKLFHVFNDDRAFTTYENIDNNHTRFKHYYKKDGKCSQIFDGYLINEEISNNQIDSKTLKDNIPLMRWA